jgi:cardiolipin synthase
VVFLLASVTDGIDGALARACNSKSAIGASLDPLADKLLVVSSFLGLAWLGAVPAWLLVLVITRDVVILVGYLALYFLGMPMEVAPTQISKVNTFLEMLTIGFALLALARPELPMSDVNRLVWYATGSTVTISGLHYVYRGLLWVQSQGGRANGKEHGTA